MKTTNNNSREVISQGNNYLPLEGSSSPNATLTQDELEAHANDNEMGTEEGATFPQKLMDALERETSRADATFAAGGARIFAWGPAGDTLVIRDKASFEEEVLTKYFNKCKFMSFTRKLYRWGFRQVSKDIQSIKIFQHVHFVRGDRQRCLKMRSLVKSQPTSREPKEHFVTSYNAVHQDQLEEIEQNRQQLVDMLNNISQHATACRLQSGGDDLLSFPGVLGLGGRPSSSLRAPINQLLQGEFGAAAATEMMKGRLRLQEMEQSRQQLMDMLSHSGQQAGAPRLPSGGNDLLSTHGVLGLGGRHSSSLPTPIDQLLRGNTGAASVEIAEGRILLQEIEQKRQQLRDLLNHRSTSQAEQSRQQLLDMLNKSSAARATAPSFDHLPAPPQPPYAAMAPDHAYGYSQHQRDASDGAMLALDIMKRGGPAWSRGEPPSWPGGFR